MKLLRLQIRENQVTGYPWAEIKMRY